MLRMTLIGHLGSDAEVRDAGGKKVISFSVAHSEKYTDRSGVKKEETTWVRCSYFREEGRTGVADYLKKGSQVYIEGVPSARSYTAKDGSAATSLECRVISLELVGGRATEGAREGGYNTGTSSNVNYGNAQQSNKPTQPTYAEPGPDADADDLPF